MKNTQKTFSVLTIIFGVLVTSSIHSEVSYLAIKGLHTSIKPEKSHLSPVHGFAWWKSGQIEKLYRYGVESDKTIQLIKKLFYLNPIDNITFDCTKIPTNVASFFSATTIGAIMHALETVGMEMETDYEQTKSDLKTALKNEIVKNLPGGMNDKLKKYQELQKKHAPIRKELETLQKEIDSLKKQMAEARQIKNNVKFNNLNKLVITKSKEKKDLYDKLKPIKNDLAQLTHAVFPPNAVDIMVDLVFEAYQESLPGEKQKYIPYTIHNILLGFLWRKTTSKQEFLDYLAAIGADTIVTTDILQKNSTAQQTWLTETYTQKELSNFESFFKSIQENQTPFEKFEQLIAHLHFYDISAQPFPPQAAGGNPTYQGITFPDCGETSLRNFFNNILYNQETKTFNFTIAEQAFGAANIHPKLRDFYKSPLSDVDKINSTQTLNKWAEVVSGLNVPEGNEQIAYRQSEVCEIDTSISNMLKVINRLIGVNNFNDLIKKLKNTGLPIKIYDNSQENFGEIHFTIENRATFVWHFKLNHFYITVETMASKSPAIDEAMNLVSQLISNSTTAQQNNALLNLIILYKDKKNLEQSLVITLENTFSPAYILHAYLLLYNLNNHEEKLTCIEKILENKILGDLPDNLSLDRLLTKIIDTLPSDDYYRLQIVSVIAKKGNALKKSEKLRNQLTKSAQEMTVDYRKADAIYELLKAKESLNTIPELKTLIEKIATSITYDYEKVRVISELLKAKELLTQIPELKTLISDIATSITDDDKKLETIHKLLEAKELFNTIPELQTLISEIAQNVNPKSITDDYQKVKTISKLLAAKELLNTIPELTTLIEKIAQKVDPTSIIGDYGKLFAIYKLLAAKESLNTMPELKTLIEKIAQKVNPTSITGDYQKVEAISNLLEAKELLNTIPELKKIIENIALSITDDSYKLFAIYELLKAKELLNTIPKLKTLISDIAKSITDDYEKVRVISELLEAKELFNTIPELKTLIENITQNVRPASITNNENKIYAISELLEAKELLNTIPELTTLISDIAKSITNDADKVDAISKLLKAKILKEIPELTTLVEKIALSLTNDYQKVEAIYELLAAKILKEIPELLDLIEKIATSIKDSSHLKTVLENITNNKEIPDNQKQLIIQKLKGLLQIPESPH